MSIKIIGVLAEANGFSDLLVSQYEDEHSLTITELYKLKILNSVYLASISSVVGLDITAKASSGFRTKKINKLIGGSSTSQHLYFEAFDLHFSNEKEERIMGIDNTEVIAKYIDSQIGDIIQQMFWYDWGIHIGIATSRKQLKKIRGER